MPAPVKIAVAEDTPAAQKALLTKLTPYSRAVELRKMLWNGQELLQYLATDAYVQVVLLDIQMPVLDGIATLKAIKKEFPHIKVVMLTVFDDDERVFEAIMAGANGYLLKETPGDKILEHLRDTLTGGAPMTPEIAAKVLKLLRQPPTVTHTATAETFELTQRQLEILEQLRAGHSYQRIAEHLFISTGTVRKHIENIYRKLQVHNKVEAVQKALEHRLI